MMLVAVCAYNGGDGGGSGDRVGGGARAYRRSRRLVFVEAFILYLFHCINMYLEYLSYFFTASAYYCTASFGEAHIYTHTHISSVLLARWSFAAHHSVQRLWCTNLLANEK